MAALKSKDPATYARNRALAQKRKVEVLKAYDYLKRTAMGRSTQGSPAGSTKPDSFDQIRLAPPINDRTFAVWIGPDAKGLKDVYSRWLQMQNAELLREQQSPVSDARREEIAASLAQNQAKIAGLQRIRDPAQLSCYFGENCGTRADISGLEVQATRSGKAWTAADFEKANAQAHVQKLVQGGKLDRSIPALAASEAVDNSPLGPMIGVPPGSGISPVGTVAELALAATGGLLLFGGLGGKQLEEKFPGIRRNMGIAALVGGSLASGAIVWEGSAARLAATAIPLAANTQAEEETSHVLPSGQAVLQRFAQSAPDVTPEGEAAAEKIGSHVATQAGRLLNAEQAEMDVRKFTEYALNPNNPDGMHKARVFKAALGYTRENCQNLIDQIRSGILSNPAVKGTIDQYGARFTVDILVKGPEGQAVVRTGWNYLPGSDIPRLTTLFVKK